MEYRIKVIVGAKKEGVTIARDGRLVVSVLAPRKDGKANARARELLARHFGCTEADVLIVRGHTTASKTIRMSSKASFINNFSKT